MTEHEKIEKIIGSYLPGFEANNDNIHSSFTNLGLDSMDIMGIFSDLESDYGVIVSDDEFNDFDTFNKLCGLLKSCQ